MVRAPDSGLTAVRMSGEACTIPPGICFILYQIFSTFFLYLFIYLFFISLLQDKFEFLHSYMVILNIHINLPIFKSFIPRSIRVDLPSCKYSYIPTYIPNPITTSLHSPLFEHMLVFHIPTASMSSFIHVFM